MNGNSAIWLRKQKTASVLKKTKPGFRIDLLLRKKSSEHKNHRINFPIHDIEDHRGSPDWGS